MQANDYVAICAKLFSPPPPIAIEELPSLISLSPYYYSGARSKLQNNVTAWIKF